MAKVGRPKGKGTIATGGGGTSIGVSKETRDKLKEKAGGVPLSLFLKRVAEAGEV